MKLSFLFIAIFFFQDEIPFKDEGEYLVQIDLKFKAKGQNGIGLSSSYSNTGQMQDDKTIQVPRAFLTVNVSEIKIREDEAKIVAIDSEDKKLLTRKTSSVPELHFDMGFVDDLKSKAAANEITIYFLSGEKKRLRKIVLTILTDGTFQVNGKWHGKF